MTLVSDYVKKQPKEDIFSKQMSRYSERIGLHSSTLEKDLTDKIIFTIQEIASLFPGEPIYSDKTRIILELTIDFFGCSIKILSASSALDNVTLLRISLLYYELSYFDFYELWNSEELMIYKKLLPIILNYQTLNRNKYTSETVNAYALTASMLVVEKSKKLDKDDMDFLVELITNSEPKPKPKYLIDFIVSCQGSRHNALLFNYLLVEYLNLFTNRETDIYSIREGSIYSQIRAFFKNGEAEKEAIEGLEDVRKMLKGKMVKEYSEIQKAESEIRKNELESKLLENKINNLDAENTAKINEANLRRIHLENENLALQNQTLKIKNFKDQIETLKVLMAESILDQEEMNLLIKGELFIQYQQDEKGLG